MAKSRFQLVGSLLRPADLREYKTLIEKRDDIVYPFYDAFDGYQETETANIKKVIAEEKANVRALTGVVEERFLKVISQFQKKNMKNGL